MRQYDYLRVKNLNLRIKASHAIRIYFMEEEGWNEKGGWFVTQNPSNQPLDFRVQQEVDYFAMSLVRTCNRIFLFSC